MSPSPVPRAGVARVHFWPDAALYASPSMHSGEHAHHALQIVLPLDDLCAADWVAADVPHSCHHDGPVLMLFVDPESALGRPLQHAAPRTGPERIDVQPVATAVQCLDALVQREAEAGTARKALEAIAGHLTRYHSPPPPMDRRVREVLDRLRKEPRHMPPLTELAAGVNLSASRLKVLFREETGISVKQYVLWLRQVRALLLGAQAQNLTQLAHESGFADAAHMSRTHRRMFDWTPSAFWRSCGGLRSQATDLPILPLLGEDEPAAE